jgi:uncharacterized membrane protein
MISLAEIVIIILVFFILLIYHVHLVYLVRTAPLKTAIGTTNQLRRDWVQTIMEDGRDILAVQTIRNWVMASSFLASSAILISLGIINHGALHYMLGMRGFYLAVLFALWLFGPTWMLIGIIILITVLYKLDRSA